MISRWMWLWAAYDRLYWNLQPIIETWHMWLESHPFIGVTCHLFALYQALQLIWSLL